MMKYWREHYHQGPRMAPSVVLSAALHAILIIAAVDATANPNTRDRELPEKSIARFLAPPDREIAQAPQAEMIRYVTIAIPEVPSAKPLADFDHSRQIQQLTHFDERDAAPAPALTGMDSIYSVVQVDSVATRYEWSAAPAYPPRMLEQATEGVVRAEFVVSQTGYVDTTSLRVLESTHPDFTKAVRDALPFMRFKPAKIGTTVVSQLVSQEFFFKIAAIDSVMTKPKP